MENIMFLSSLLVNILTIISIIIVIRKEKQKEMRSNEERLKEFIKAVSEQKDKEYQKEQDILRRIRGIEDMYDNELDTIKMSIQQVENQKSVEIEKLRASIEKLMVSIESLNDRVTELVRRVSEIEKLTKVLYEFIGYTKGEKNAKRKTN